jgi:type VI secretion system secreted protein VgrG
MAERDPHQIPPRTPKQSRGKMSAEEAKIREYVESMHAMREAGDWPGEDDMLAAAREHGLSESDVAQVQQMAQAHRELANAMMQQGDVDGAIREFAQAVPIQPTDAALITEAATAHASRFQEWGNPSDLAAAESLASRALELVPDLPPAVGLMSQLAQAAAPAIRAATSRRAARRSTAAQEEEASEAEGRDGAGHYTQEGRSMRVDTVLEEDELLLHSFTGVEGISTPFSFRLRLLSEDDSVSAEDLLRTPAYLSIELENGETRHIHGLINRFVQGDQEEDLTAYEAEIVPWLWFLNLSRDCKIFQEKSVLDIVEEVFTGLGFSDFDIRCTRNYLRRTYCVQYRESHLNFVRRLMEEEGIFYFFEHSENGHVLVLADSNSSIEELQHKPTASWRSDPVPQEDVVTALRSETSVHIGTVTLQDYDFEQPTMNLLSTITGPGGQEIYDYHPRRYTRLEEGERYARLALEALEAGRHIVYGEGNCRAFTSGYRFELEDHYSSELNLTYTLAQVSHSGSAGDYRSGGGTAGDYHNSFMALPHDVPYRPQPLHRKPTVHGSQTAIVVGPPGEEIYTDSYGRVKVQFYWDRLGARDENSSCWIRVGTPWAGGGYGSVSIPRIDNEVIVDFLEGDPDRPLIVGSVYNANEMPPLELPGAGIEMGMKSRSSPGGGGANQITMRDTAGEEMLTVTAQHDMTTSVGHDQSTGVTNDRSVTVGGKLTETIKKDATITVTDGNYSVNVGKGTADEYVKSNKGAKVDGTYTIESKGDMTVGVTGGDLTLASSGGSVLSEGKAGNTVKSPADVTLDGKNINQTASANISLDGQKISLTGATEVTLGVGGNFVKIDASGVTVFGTLVKIN